MTVFTTGTFARRFGPLVEPLTDEEITLLYTALEFHEVAAGEALIAEGTLAESLYLVWEGELDVFVEIPEGEEAIGQVLPGGILGEVSLLYPGPATATARAEQGCSVLRLSRERFDDLCAQHINIALELVRELSRALMHRTRAANMRYEQLHKELNKDTERNSRELMDVQAKLHGSEGAGT